MSCQQVAIAAGDQRLKAQKNTDGGPGWWLGHPSEKYEFVNWDDGINPILMGKFQEWQPNHQPVANSWSLPTRSLRVTGQAQESNKLVSAGTAKKALCIIWHPNVNFRDHKTPKAYFILFHFISHCRHTIFHAQPAFLAWCRMATWQILLSTHASPNASDCLDSPSSRYVLQDMPLLHFS